MAACHELIHACESRFVSDFHSPDVKDVSVVLSGGAPAQRPPRLLLAEDASTRDFLCELLRDHYELEVVNDGEQAWEAARRLAPDLVLSDVLMPGMDGIELTRRLRANAHTATVPVVLLTASGEKELLLRGLEAGADDFLIKPFSPPELRARLHSHRQLFDLRRQVARHQGEERYRLIVESARDYAIFTFDAQRRVTAWNAGAGAMTGFKASDILGRSADLLFTPEDRERGVPALETSQALATGRFYNERWHLRKDGTRFWGSGVVMPLREGGPQPGCLKILRDQTALHHAEDERTRLLQAEQAARREAEAANQTKDRFLAALSHEMRTPLAPIRMALHLLTRHKKLPDSVRQAHEMIRRNVDTEIRLIEDLLDVSRITHGKLELNPEPTDLHAAVQQALEVCQEDFVAKELQLSVALAAGRSQVMGDAHRLQQVFCNLLKNAAKFTPKGGHIAVRSSGSDGSIVVEVSDTGIGIEAGALPKVFDPFEQGEARHAHRHGGLGLGLAISHAIVAAHGGQITAESLGPNQGAIFRVRLSTRTD